MGKEQNNRIIFLDYTVINKNNAISYDIYIKPKRRNSIINARSSHFKLDKHAAVRSTSHRLENTLLAKYNNRNNNKEYKKIYITKNSHT